MTAKYISLNIKIMTKIKTQKQVCDVKAGKGMTIAQSNEHLRIGAQNAYLKKVAGTMDPTREQLNFEVGAGGVVKPLNKGNSIPKRIKENLKARGVIDPNLGLEEPNRRTVVNIILGGSTERMRELAFGDQQVNYERGADNSEVTRKPAIEQWAVDIYRFMAKKYGENNIAAFIVHLDETNPHVHCTLLPITPKNKFSYVTYFGKTKEEGCKKFWELHNQLAEVNKKYGLARGESKLKTGAQHKSYKQWLEERIADNALTIAAQQEVLKNLNREIKKAETRLKGLTTMLNNVKAERTQIVESIERLSNAAVANEDDRKAREAELLALKSKLQLTEEKIADREKQLEEADKQLKELQAQQAENQAKCDALSRHIDVLAPTAQQRAIKEMKQTEFDIMAGEVVELKARIRELSSSLPDEYQAQADSLLHGLLLDTVAEKGDSVTTVSSNLWQGLIQAAIIEASHCGGGAAEPDDDWGRKQDESDLDFRRRCIMMGANMLARAPEPLETVKRRRGLRR